MDMLFLMHLLQIRIAEGNLGNNSLIMVSNVREIDSSKMIHENSNNIVTDHTMAEYSITNNMSPVSDSEETLTLEDLKNKFATIIVKFIDKLELADIFIKSRKRSHDGQIVYISSTNYMKTFYHDINKIMSDIKESGKLKVIVKQFIDKLDRLLKVTQQKRKNEYLIFSVNIDNMLKNYIINLYCIYVERYLELARGFLKKINNFNKNNLLSYEQTLCN